MSILSGQLSAIQFVRTKDNPRHNSRNYRYRRLRLIWLSIPVLGLCRRRRVSRSRPSEDLGFAKRASDASSSKPETAFSDSHFRLQLQECGGGERRYYQKNPEELRRRRLIAVAGIVVVGRGRGHHPARGLPPPPLFATTDDDASVRSWRWSRRLTGFGYAASGSGGTAGFGRRRRLARDQGRGGGQTRHLQQDPAERLQMVIT